MRAMFSSRLIYIPISCLSYMFRKFEVINCFLCVQEQVKAVLQRLQANLSEIILVFLLLKKREENNF